MARDADGMLSLWPTPKCSVCMNTAVDSQSPLPNSVAVYFEEWIDQNGKHSSRKASQGQELLQVRTSFRFAPLLLMTVLPETQQPRQDLGGHLDTHARLPLGLGIVPSKLSESLLNALFVCEMKVII